MALQFELIPWGTRVESNGEGEKVDISASQTRTFLCTLEIADQIEQESIDVSIWISEDGENWSTKPILKLPQQFYRGEKIGRASCRERVEVVGGTVVVRRI